MSSNAETQSKSDGPNQPTRFVVVAFCEERIVPYELPTRAAVTFGRGDACELRIDHPSVSRTHARFRAGEHITVEDLESRNGTQVRGVPVRAKHPVPIEPGDVVECGDVLILLRALPADAPTDLAPAEALAATQAPIGELVVGGDGRWFQTLPGAKIDLGRRGALRRMLVELARQRLSRPGIGLKVAELIEVGWPNERMQYDSALARVYTTINRLRALGLEQVLLTRDDGYLFDPSLQVRLEKG